MNSRRDLPGSSGSLAPGGSAPEQPRDPSLGDLYHAAHARRGGGELFTTGVNDPLGAWVAALAIRFRVHPTVVTLTGLSLAVVACLVVITRAGSLQPLWVPGLVALVCWQLVYTLDCADGQIARVTGKSSSFGARLDVLVDFGVQITVVAALMTVVAQRIDYPVALVVLGALVWPIGLLLHALRQNDGNIGRSITHLRRPIALIQTVRDNGARLFLVGVWLFIHPESVVIPVAAICVTNACVLMASIAREGYLSMRSGSAIGRREEKVVER